MTTVTNFNSRVRIFREFCKSLEVDIFLTASLLFLHGCYYKTDIVKLAYSMYIFLSPVFLLVKIVFYKTFKASSNQCFAYVFFIERIEEIFLIQELREPSIVLYISPWSGFSNCLKSIRWVAIGRNKSQILE